MSKEIGTLVVVVLKARNLRDKHTIHKQDAYAQATLNKNIKKTAVDVRGGQHPIWDEELRFSIVKEVSDDTRKLEISCYSKEPRQDDLIGRGSVDISDTLKTGEFDDWVPLQTEDGSYRGEIFLEMTYFAAAAPPQRRPSKWVPSDRLKRPDASYAYPSSPPKAGSQPNGRKTPVPNGQSTAVLKYDPLPSLPEEPTPAAASIPASLRPGGGAFPRTSPKSSTRLLPPDHDTPPVAGHSPRSSLESVPPYLRPGGGAPPCTDPKCNTGLLPPDHPVHAQATQTSPRRDPAIAAHSSLDSVPPYLRPGGGAPPRTSPQPHAALIPPVHTEAPRSPSRDSPPAAYQSPLESMPPYIRAGASAGAPHLQSYIQIPEPRHTPVQPYHPSPPIPAPGIPSYGSPPHAFGSLPPFHPQNHSPYAAPRYGSPPREYPSYGAGGAPPPPCRTIQPPQSYPSYNIGAWGQRECGAGLPDPYLQKRYQSPLPLPDGARHPQVSQFQAPPPLQMQASIHPLPAEPTPAPMPKGPSEEERDRELALKIEKKEEERRRLAREQEERDMELARQLDLELNV